MGVVGAQRRCAPTDKTSMPISPPMPRRDATNVIPGSLGAIVRALKPAAKRIARDAGGARAGAQ